MLGCPAARDSRWVGTFQPNAKQGVYWKIGSKRVKATEGVSSEEFLEHEGG